MIKTLKISNFRSIKDVSLDLAPVNFFYGNNATGKSSIFYALAVLRKIIEDPNQATDIFFNLGFANLGSFEDVVHKHDLNQPITFAVSGKYNKISFSYKIVFKSKSGEFTFEVGKPYTLKFNIPVTFPYPLNKSVDQTSIIDNISYNVTWNGVTFQFTPQIVTEDTSYKAAQYTTELNQIIEHIKSVDIAPILRGFTRVTYGIIPLSKFPLNEDQVATSLATDEVLDSKVSAYLEQVVDRQVRSRTKPGSALIRISSIEKSTKQPVDLVNDGFGINQLVYLLAKTLTKNLRIVCIEEPEINLHPSIIRKLPFLLIEIAREEEKQIIISTHSETFMVAVLEAVSKKLIRSEDIACYLTTKANSISNYKKQTITREGQINGGLVSFIEDEIGDTMSFFPKKGKTDEPQSLEEKLTEEAPTVDQDEPIETSNENPI